MFSRMLCEYGKAQPKLKVVVVVPFVFFLPKLKLFGPTHAYTRC